MTAAPVILSLGDCRARLGSDVRRSGGKDALLLTGASCDSRRIVPGMLFCAVRGTHDDGRKYLRDALAAGAAAVLTEHAEIVPDGIPFLEVPDARKASSILTGLFCGDPDRKLKLFGVTGTNGKTTTAYLLRTFLSSPQSPCGLLSTVEVCDGMTTEPARWTTPEAEALFPAFRRMAENGCAFCAMELSSHALAQDRTGNARFSCAIFTNLTGDHLDYHKDMEHYYQAKKRLFAELLSPDGLAIMNCDDASGKRMASELRDRRVTTFGESDDAGQKITILELAASGSHFRLGEVEYHTNLAGRHNVFNLSGAILAARFAGVSESKIAEKMLDCHIPGRLERCTVPGKTVFVDYAHTDDALKNVLTFLRGVCTGRLIVVFGAGGDRDRTKRPRMGRVVSGMADCAVITSDNPRSENPDTIITEILAGFVGRAELKIEPDRAKAIAWALALACSDDIVLIAGKGHEDYQEISGVRHPFSDRKTVELLAVKK